MAEEYNNYQIIRKDARGCFVESLNDYFDKGKIHLGFSSYDINMPPGQRQTDNIQIFIGVDELQEICRKLSSGELRFLVNQRRSTNNPQPLLEWLGGTSAEKLKKMGKSRKDGKSLSRTAKLLCGNKTDFLFVADSGPGEKNGKGLIVPKFGKNPENHVNISMTWESLSELFLVTKEHYQAWLSAKYLKDMMNQKETAGEQSTDESEYESLQENDWTRMQERSENPFLMKQAQNVAQGQAVASGRQNMTMGAYWNQQAVG